ncbi:hypothetical protein Acr_00g0064550 [Actinidia rufa]|uniref:Uncharacterized protein n=1 Tax=Actinidia rufa TaxID=165716 RepID=A0A7J0DRE8_9ERIC|nr:hypothetical protein Acr_00g0064550 [Actinidia rufa]
MGGLAIIDSNTQSLHYHNHKGFLFRNYFLLGATSAASSSSSSSTSSPSPVPSLDAPPLPLPPPAEEDGGVSGSTSSSISSGRWYGVHMVARVLTSIFQGSVSVLIFTRTGDFLGNLKSYVREEDGAISGCASSSNSSGRWYGVHKVATVLTSIFQGSVSVLIFSRTGGFSGEFEILCERRRWICDTEIGWRVERANRLFGVGCGW